MRFESHQINDVVDKHTLIAVSPSRAQSANTLPQGNFTSEFNQVFWSRIHRGLVQTSWSPVAPEAEVQTPACLGREFKEVKRNGCIDLTWCQAS